MGNCCLRCFGRIEKRKYLRTHYNVARELSVEFDSLIDEDVSQSTDLPQYGAVLTEQERKLITERRFNDLVQYQLKVDAEIHTQLHEQEEQLRREEEVFLEAKRQAARVASRLRNDEQVKQAKRKVEAWVSTDEWEIANGEDDFEQFLESVRLRSLNARMRVVPSQVVQIDSPGSDAGGIKDETPSVV